MRDGYPADHWKFEHKGVNGLGNTKLLDGLTACHGFVCSNRDTDGAPHSRQALNVPSRHRLFDERKVVVGKPTQHRYCLFWCPRAVCIQTQGDVWSDCSTDCGNARDFFFGACRHADFELDHSVASIPGSGRGSGCGITIARRNDSVHCYGRSGCWRKEFGERAAILSGTKIQERCFECSARCCASLVPACPMVQDCLRRGAVVQIEGASGEELECILQGVGWPLGEASEFPMSNGPVGCDQGNERAPAQRRAAICCLKRTAQRHCVRLNRETPTAHRSTPRANRIP